MSFVSRISGWLLRCAGWSVEVTVPDYPKQIICVAPHTSNWDFIIGKLAYASIGRHAGFLMKEAWFFFPLGLLLKGIGGIPVPRRKGTSLVEAIVRRFNESGRMSLAITPEGTRSRTCKWRHGFLYIAMEANVPIVLAAIDFKMRKALIQRTFTPTGDVDADLEAIKQYYSSFTGRYPEKFCTECQQTED